MSREELAGHKGGRGRREPYIHDFQVICVVCGRVSVLNILPNDLSLFRIFVHHLEGRRLEIRARETPREPHRGRKNNHRLS